MPLNTPPAPIEAANAFHSGLTSFLAGPQDKIDVKHQAFIGGAPKLPTIADVEKTIPGPTPPAALQNFTLGLRALHRAGGIASAKSGSWRFFAGATAADAIAGHCLQDPSTGAWRLTNLAYGTRVLQMIEASKGLDQLTGLPPLDGFELRYLTIPGILVEAFWLVAPAGGTDLAVMFPAPPNQLQRQLSVRPFYELPIFLNIVSTLSAERLRFAAGKGS